MLEARIFGTTILWPLFRISARAEYDVLLVCISSSSSQSTQD
jgi:hypothetical protein